MHKPSLKEVVYKALVPFPRLGDPEDFDELTDRCLCSELRSETIQFYGHLDRSIEALFPGLDYTYAPHRMRLSRFPWHAALFKAFDDLRLTDEEISSICTWERTKYAREQYERASGVEVCDTTAEGVRVHVRPYPSVEVHFYRDENGNEIVPEREVSDTALAVDEWGCVTPSIASELELPTEPIEDGTRSDTSGDTEPIDDSIFNARRPPLAAGPTDIPSGRMSRHEYPRSNLPLSYWMRGTIGRFDPRIIAHTYLRARMGYPEQPLTPELISSLTSYERPPGAFDVPHIPEQRQRNWDRARDRLQEWHQREDLTGTPPPPPLPPSLPPGYPHRRGRGFFRRSSSAH